MEKVEEDGKYMFTHFEISTWTDNLYRLLYNISFWPE